MPCCCKCKKDFLLGGSKKAIIKRFGVLLTSIFFLGLCIVTYIAAPGFDYIATTFLVLLLIGSALLFNAFIRYCDKCIDAVYEGWSNSP